MILKKLGLLSIVAASLAFSGFPVHSDSGLTPVATNLMPQNNFVQLEPQTGEAYGRKMTYIEVPSGYNFYKAMEPISFDNDELENARANQPSWFGDMITAMRYVYASQKWIDGRATNWDVHAFKTIRPTKLLLLSDLNNLDLISDLVEGDMKRIAKKIADLEESLLRDGELTNYQQQYMESALQKEKREWQGLKNDFIDFQVALGYHISNEEQLEQLRYASINGEERVAAHLRTLEGETEVDPNEDNLNRISYTPLVDVSILNFLKRYFCVDGYYNSKVHSNWHNQHVFQQEVAFIETRSLLARDFQNPYDWTNKDSSVDYAEAVKGVQQLFREPERP